MSDPLLSVSQLSLFHQSQQQHTQLIQEISFFIQKQEIVGLVGESGSGKSLTAQSILQLLPRKNFKISGSIHFEDKELLTLSEKELRQIRGKRIALMSQDPSAALNPTLTIQTQLLEGLCRTNSKITKKEAIRISTEWLERMHVPNASLRMRQYPHELSGGTKQRIALAMALISEPALLLADEPTTALDMTVQAEILLLFKELVQKNQLSVLLITHDLGVVANCCDRVLVLKAGHLVETGTVDEIFSTPKHAYTQSLLQSKRNLLAYAN